MFALALFLVLAQATPAVPAPSAQPTTLSPLPGWSAVPPAAEFEYVHLIRHEADGTDSVLFASRRVCDCQVEPMIAALARSFAAISRGAATERVATATVCGQTAAKLLVTGIATPSNAIRNAELILFRDNDALVVMNYSFRGTDPMGDAEAALPTLCPPKTV